MAQSFEVREIDLTGVVITTIYNAEDEAMVLDMIRQKGHTPVLVQLAADIKDSNKKIDLFPGKIKIKDLFIFCKQVSTMLYAGMPLIESLIVIKEQSSNKRMRKVSSAMIEQLQKGEMLSSSMKRHDRDFPKILIEMVETGEVSGNLDEVLAKMADHFAKEHKINQKVKSAMIYPAFIAIIAVAAIVYLLIAVMPTFVDMFRDGNVELPAVTQKMLDFSNFVRHYWHVLVMAIIFMGWAMRRFFKSPKGKYLFDCVVIKLPFIKNAVVKIATARFTRTLAMLLSSGISLLDALRYSTNVTNNAIIIKGINEVADDIKKGIKLSALLKRVDIFPKMMISMVRVGEESGAIEEMLNRSANFYEDELEEAIKQLTSLIEPLMILIVAVMVGFIVMAMILPLFEMFKTIN